MGDFESTSADASRQSAAELMPRHHAALFGIIARNAIEHYGEEGRAAVIQAVKEYGLQRGRRMRKRAMRNGDAATMAAYRAYCEWKAPEGSIRSAVVQRSPVLVTRTLSCPWYNSWKEHGLSEEGGCYCDHVDKYLAMGFDEDLKLEVKRSFSDGALEYCEFTWHGVDYTEENERLAVEMRSRLEEGCVLDWLYHLRHLFHSMSRTLARLLKGSEQIMRKSREDFLALFGDRFSIVFDEPDLTDYDEI